MNAQAIDKALSHYDNWSIPWEYMSDVRSYPGLDESSMQEIEKMWSEVNSEEVWVYPSHKSGMELARETLTASYPWLSGKAIDNLIRGASYNWK